MTDYNKLVEYLNGVPDSQPPTRIELAQLIAENDRLRRENERLRAEANLRGLTAAQRVDSIRDLQARLSAAEEARDDAREVNRKLMKANTEWRVLCERAEAVVEAVKEAQRDWLPDDDPISIAIRRYEEEKK